MRERVCECKPPAWTQDWREVQRRADEAGKLCEQIIAAELEKIAPNAVCYECDKEIHVAPGCLEGFECHNCRRPYCWECWEPVECCCGEEFCSYECRESHLP